MYAELSPLLRVHVKLFQCLGCFAASLHRNAEVRRRTERRLIAWIMLLSASFIAVTCNTFLQQDKFLFMEDRFGYFNDALKVIVAQINIIIIHVETIVQRGAIYTFWHTYGGLQAGGSRILGDDTSWRAQLRKHARFMLIFYGINLLEFGVEVVFLSQQEMSGNMLNFWSFFTPYIYMAHLRNMQAILHVELIRQELAKLERDLGLLAEYASFSRRLVAGEGFEELLRGKLVEKQRAYQQIYEMFVSFQKGFGLSIIAVLLMLYVRVLVGSYFIYYTQYQRGYTFDNVLMLPSLFEIPVFLITSKNCMSVVKHITFQLHSIRSRTDNTLVSVQIQNFSLQILHQKIRIDGIGITQLDGYMLSKAVGSIVTYMILFVQFMPKFHT